MSYSSSVTLRGPPNALSTLHRLTHYPSDNTLSVEEENNDNDNKNEKEEEDEERPGV